MASESLASAQGQLSVAQAHRKLWTPSDTASAALVARAAREGEMTAAAYSRACRAVVSAIDAWLADVAAMGWLESWLSLEGKLRTLRPLHLQAWTPLRRHLDRRTSVV